ncbi:hypothetical protein L1987_23017 [Smallanthus sonchifolius]|uniref:Uncharacterized protein n=1 Tax=Smallanthus sonchifolius TaxID=185202 RepID=A0ACB9II73_9ASTR|nr:hypothetical protein L1987_23017 [Smallanthus sonchifolius]
MGGICSRLRCAMRRNDREDEQAKLVGVPQNGKQSVSDRVSGSKWIEKIISIVGESNGEQKVAGWPSWLTSVAPEAVQGWDPRSDDSYEMLNKIGQGTYSSVYKARDLQNDTIVAIKKVRFVNNNPVSVCFMAREIRIMRMLDHQNCMKLQALVTSKFSGSLYLVFDYMEHDLDGLLQAQQVNRFTLPQVSFFSLHIYDENLKIFLVLDFLLNSENRIGLDKGSKSHCHSRGILHRDLKGSNILVDNNGIVKIGDFGLATRFEPGQEEPLTSRVVTLWYRAPELLFGSTSYGVAIDMWSVGCILAELFTGMPIMPGRTEVEQIHRIFMLCGSPSEEYWKISKFPHTTNFKPQQPYKRCIIETFQQLLPPSALALLDTLLAIEPDIRGTATSALSSEFFTTEPLPCDPSKLPSYPPRKEFDARNRKKEARRRKAEAMRGQVSESVRVSAGELKAQTKTQVPFSKLESF